MSRLGALKSYAKRTIPSPSLPSSVLFSYSNETMTIFDLYPKAVFHFLVLPRLKPGMNHAQYSNLKSLLRADKAKAKECIETLKRDASKVKELIEEEMMSKYGCKWTVNMGFHAVPSMDHIHLHVVSSDLCSPSLKTKKHYNSFHPEHGFFLHVDEVLEWFEADDSYYRTISALPKTEYESILGEPLSCWRCGKAASNIPTLKQHLREEWAVEKERERKRAKVKGEKRKREEVDAEMMETEPTPKRVHKDCPPGKTLEAMEIED